MREMMFLGGPWDGRTRPFERTPPDHLQVPADLNPFWDDAFPESITTEYRLVKIGAVKPGLVVETGMRRVYVASGVGDEEALDLLRGHLLWAWTQAGREE